ncbi:DMT family transporter [Carboxydocella sp. ULO1]|uniref:DMT family transporter n=1 Tax=Carboxydocella sp. ULO1 TaxID=1926599 RepID=UPI0009AD0F20|nr:DMT family transporter [Carboxydocella sp. ULO1]GAW28692.1 EamA family transporter [Carboxydocella sp. ULO1]
MLKNKGELALLVVTLIWGTTFIVTKLGLGEMPPFSYLAIRFTIAALVLGVIFWQQIKALPAGGWWAGIKLGLVLGAGFVLQTLGLLSTTASKSAFITGLAVVLTPVVAFFLYGQKPSRAVWLGSLLAFTGLALLSWSPELVQGEFNRGDVLTLLCAIAFALHIVLVSRYAGRYPTGPFTWLQLLVIGLGCWLFSWWTGESWLMAGKATWLGLLYMGVIATGLVLFLQNWGQRFTSAQRAAIIFTLEPVFTAVFAFVFLRETPTLQLWLGGTLILVGILYSEIGDQRIKSRELEIMEANDG